MNNDCLVTKLKSSIDNPELIKINEYKLYVGDISSVSKLGNFAASEYITVTIYNGHFTDSTGTENSGKTITAKSFSDAYIIGEDPSKEAYVVFSDKRKIRTFFNGDDSDVITRYKESSHHINIYDLKYFISLKVFAPNGAMNISGNIKDLPRDVSDRLALTSNPVIGELSDMPLGIIRMAINNTSITGYINDFIEKRIENNIFTDLSIYAKQDKYYKGTNFNSAQTLVKDMTSTSYFVYNSNMSKYDKWEKISGVWTLTEANQDA